MAENISQLALRNVAFCGVFIRHNSNAEPRPLGLREKECARRSCKIGKIGVPLPRMQTCFKTGMVLIDI